MIQEAYVSREVAELLKAKGFPQDPSICNTAYTLRGLSNNAKSFVHNSFLAVPSRCYSIAPTQQMACKWLREVYNIHFLFDPYLDENYNIRYSIIVVFGSNVVDPIYKTDGDFTYEQACEAAIKYCLENLI